MTNPQFLNIVWFVLMFAGLLILFKRFRDLKGKKQPAEPLSVNGQAILVQHVPFYNQLDTAGKRSFEARMMSFLAKVRITGVKTTVAELDRILIAASAIIPIYRFPDWQYINLHEVLLYPGTFNHEFTQEGANRDILGMVGSGPMNNVMILSQEDLREGFINNTGKGNTAIHEFVHLVDKTDGSVDGVPDVLLSKQYVLPWLDLMRREIAAIQTGHSDINPYGATNNGEFFAVAAEYFFERPDLLEQKHPELYKLLVRIFQQPGTQSVN